MSLLALPRPPVPRPSTAVPSFSPLRSPERNVAEQSLCKSEVEHDEYASLLKKRANEIVTNLRGTCIFLIGMMGCGKTTVGKLLADALGYHFLDSDQLIEEAAGGISVAHLFEEHSESGFRDAETKVLKQLSCRDRLVVATGGGIVVRPINWNYLRHGVTVWLDVPLEALAARVVAVGTCSRPLLWHSVGDAAISMALAKLSTIFKVRGPFYGDADATVCLRDFAARQGHEDASFLTPTMVAVEMLVKMCMTRIPFWQRNIKGHIDDDVGRKVLRVSLQYIEDLYTVSWRIGRLVYSLRAPQKMTLTILTGKD